MTDLNELERLLREATLPPQCDPYGLAQPRRSIVLDADRAALWDALFPAAEELIRDARRYRWLRDSMDMLRDNLTERQLSLIYAAREAFSDGDAAEVDAAIDAAIAQERKE